MAAGDIYADQGISTLYNTDLFVSIQIKPM